MKRIESFKKTTDSSMGQAWEASLLNDMVKKMNCGGASKNNVTKPINKTKAE